MGIDLALILCFQRQSASLWPCLPQREKLHLPLKAVSLGGKSAECFLASG